MYCVDGKNKLCAAFEPIIRYEIWPELNLGQSFAINPPANFAIASSLLYFIQYLFPLLMF